jgi:hypothetical protein
MSDYEIVGPFATHWVVVNGRQVPFLEAAPTDTGWGNCYNCHPRAGMEPVRSSPFPPTHAIDWAKAGPDELPATG